MIPVAFLGSKNAHEPCSLRIQAYLERARGQDRALARDFLNLSGKEDSWALAMDLTREKCGNQTSRAGSKAVTYSHFVISPDPSDGVSLETLRELSVGWAAEFFGSESEDGKLGTYEVAIVYHDDNANGVLHAHLIVNNTDLETGRRLHIGKRENERDLPDRLQEIAAGLGLSHFDNSPEARVERRAREAYRQRGRYFTKPEREILRRGAWSWKQDLANMVQIARRTSSCEEDFLSELGMLGVAAKVESGDYVFAHPKNPTRWRSSGYRLGKAYRREEILSWMKGAPAEIERGGAYRENVNAYVLKGLFESMEAAAVVAEPTTLAETARALKANDDHRIRRPEDYDRALRALAMKMRAVGSEEAAKLYKRQCADLKFARDLSDRGAFFAGVGGAAAHARDEALKAAGKRSSPKSSEEAALKAIKVERVRSAERNRERGR